MAFVSNKIIFLSNYLHFHAVGVLYMAAIDDLIDKIEDNELRLRIAKEVKELQK